jgi:acetyl-CoA acetyltransferase
MAGIGRSTRGLARTGVGKDYRGALNNTEGPTMAGHVMAEAARRAGIAPGEVEDVVMGCAMQQGTMVMNVARKWELNEAYAVQVIYCRDKLGIDPEKLSVNGGSIAIGHPYGMTGARLTGHVLIEAHARRNSAW